MGAGRGRLLLGQFGGLMLIEFQRRGRRWSHFLLLGFRGCGVSLRSRMIANNTQAAEAVHFHL